MKGPIFLSYRRDADSVHVRDIEQLLQQAFGAANVFRDAELQGGEPWAKRIEDEVARASLVIVVYSQGWYGVQPDSGKRRIDEDGDWVRREVVLARRHGRPLLPVIVDGSAPPGAHQLPSSIAFLAQIQFQRFDRQDEASRQDLVEQAREAIYGNRWWTSFFGLVTWLALLVSLVALAGHALSGPVYDDAFARAALALRARLPAVLRPPPDDVAVVEVDDGDFTNLFGAREPLDPMALSLALRRLGGVSDARGRCGPERPVVILPDVAPRDASEGADAYQALRVELRRLARCRPVVLRCPWRVVRGSASDETLRWLRELGGAAAPMPAADDAPGTATAAGVGASASTAPVAPVADAPPPDHVRMPIYFGSTLPDPRPLRPDRRRIEPAAVAAQLRASLWPVAGLSRPGGGRVPGCACGPIEASTRPAGDAAELPACTLDAEPSTQTLVVPFDEPRMARALSQALLDVDDVVDTPVLIVGTSYDASGDGATRRTADGGPAAAPERAPRPDAAGMHAAIYHGMFQHAPGVPLEWIGAAVAASALWAAAVAFLAAAAWSKSGQGRSPWRPPWPVAGALAALCGALLTTLAAAASAGAGATAPPLGVAAWTLVAAGTALAAWAGGRVLHAAAHRLEGADGALRPRMRATAEAAALLGVVLAPAVPLLAATLAPDAGWPAAALALVSSLAVAWTVVALMLGAAAQLERHDASFAKRLPGYVAAGAVIVLAPALPLLAAVARPGWSWLAGLLALVGSLAAARAMLAAFELLLLGRPGWIAPVVSMRQMLSGRPQDILDASLRLLGFGAEVLVMLVALAIVLAHARW